MNADSVSSSSTYCAAIIMHYTFGTALIVLLTLATWKYKEMDHDKIDSTLMEQEKENEREKVSPTLMEQEPESQLKKNSTKLKLKGGPFINPALTAFSLDTVFFLLLIHTFGVSLVGSISTVCLHISSPLALVELACSLIFAVYAKYKWKRKKAELEKKNEQLQKESLNERQAQEHVVAKLEEVKAELENQRDRLKRHLEEAEAASEENKKKLQLVEADITEREKSCDIPQELLDEKQNLLWAQWKLDETKKNSEQQMLNIERLLEPTETQFTNMH